MTSLDELLAAMLPADPAVRSVQIEDEDGLHIMFYGSAAGDDRYADGGTLIIPRAVLDS